MGRYVAATLPDNWYNDPVFAEPIYQKIDRLYKDKLTDIEIAEKTGVSVQTVYRFRKRRYLPPNSIGGGQPGNPNQYMAKNDRYR